jgi:glycosyltransferase involved in cell wall biosynthesis
MTSSSKKETRSSKICFVCFAVKPGGGNRVIFEICDQIDKIKEAEYELIYLSGKSLLELAKSESFSKISKIRARKIGIANENKFFMPLNILIAFFYLLATAWKYQAIIINSPLLSPCFGLIPFKNIYNYIQADDYIIFDDRFSKTTKILLNTYKWVTKNISYQLYGERYIFNSKFTKERFEIVSDRKVASSRFAIPGVDLEIFKPLNLPSKPEKNSIVISSVLRKQPWKGTTDFLTAVEELSPKLPNGVKFVGITNEDISSLKIPSALTISRPSCDADLVSLLQESDIFVVTSHWEGFGLPGLEAMACGCALISTDNGGCDEYVIDRENCYLYKSQDIQQLVNLITLLVDDKTIRSKLESNGLQTSSSFSWGETTKGLINSISI